MLMHIVDMTNLKFVTFNPFFGIKKEYYEYNYQNYSANFFWSTNTLLIYSTLFAIFTVIGYQLYTKFLFAIRGPRMMFLKAGTWFMFNFHIRLAIQTCLVFGIAACMNLQIPDFSTWHDGLGTVLSFIYAPVMFAIPFAMGWFLIHFRYDVPYMYMINRCESAYNEVRTHRLSGLMYNVIQCGRRLFLVIVIVGFRNMQAIQF